MVEIRYGENYQTAELAGKSIAQVREQYKLTFEIPDEAKVILNRRYVKKKLEPETILKDEANAIPNRKYVKRELEAETILKDEDELIFTQKVWVEIRCGEQYDLADLASCSIGEARELYKEALAIPDDAPAKLNGKQIKAEEEYRTRLFDGDSLEFKLRNRKAAILLAALLTALLATSGFFAFGYTTATITLTAATETDFAKVETFTTPSGYTSNWTAASIMGRFKGSIPTGDLFKITRNTNYTGDLLVKVYLTNVDKLVKGYQFLNMRLQIRDDVGTGGSVIDKQYTDEGQTYQLLTLENGVVATFQLDSTASPAYMSTSPVAPIIVPPGGGHGLVSNMYHHNSMLRLRR